MKYKLIAMDLDGTLTQHKSRLEEKNRNLLFYLKKDYELVILGAGSCMRIYKQMNEFPIDIVGNYGIQQSTIKNNEFCIIRDDCYSIDKDFFEGTIDEIRRATGYTNYTGESVEFHQSGMVTFPLLGTEASLEEKLSFDPNGKKRSAIYGFVASHFPGYNCFIGGTSSFDIPAKRYDKYNALVDYIKDKNIDIKEVLFLGDDFKKGGNDEQIMLNGVDYIKINNYNNVEGELLNKGIIGQI